MDKYQVYCAMREASVLSKMKDINVLSLKDYYMCENYVCLVTDFMDMSLMDYLNDYYDELTKDQKLSIFFQIVKAVDYCHD